MRSIITRPRVCSDERRDGVQGRRSHSRAPLSAGDWRPDLLAPQIGTLFLFLIGIHLSVDIMTSRAGGGRNWFKISVEKDATHFLKADCCGRSNRGGETTVRSRTNPRRN